MAGQPLGVIALIALGYRSLSMSGRSVPRVKYLIRGLQSDMVEKLVPDILKAETSENIRLIISQFMEKNGLGGFARGGI